MTMRWLRRLGRSLFHTADDRQVAEELRQHVDFETDDLVRQGVPPAEARRRALMTLGGADRFREEARDTRSVRWLSAARRDIGYTLRSLRAAPGFATVVVVTLALGIGANTTFFSILNTLVLKQLPVHDPDRLVQIEGGDWTYPIWEQVHARQSQFAGAAFAWARQWDGFDLGDGGMTDPAEGAYVSGDMFRILGVTAVRGRVITPEDDSRAGGADGPVAVVSYRFWQERFGGNDSAIGTTLVINSVPVTIVGVTPRSFFGMEVGRSFDVMLPFALKPSIEGDPRALDRRSNWWVSIGARLAPGQSVEQAEAALRALQPAIREATIPEDYPPQVAAGYFTDPLELTSAATGASALRSRYQPALLTIMAVVGLVLLIACANVANLLLARACARQREFSVRLALGASRARIVFQLLIESLIVSSLGAIAGLFVATWGSALVVAQLTTWQDAVYLDLSPDWYLFGFLVMVTATTTVVFGLSPAWSLRTSSPNDALRDGGRGTVGDRRIGTRNALVVVQLALSLVLLVAAGLFLRTFVTLNSTSTGMAIDELLAVDVDLRRSSVPAESRGLVIERMRETVAALPGVTGAATSTITPLSGRAWNAGVGDVFPPPRDRMTWMNGVSPGWFDTVGARVIEGRDFTPADNEGVAIVNQAFAQRFLEPGPATGQTFRLAAPEGGGDLMHVVGLASDVMYRRPREGMVPTLFLPLGADRVASSLLVRVAPGQKAPITRTIAGTLQGADPEATFSVRSYDDLASATVAHERLTAGLATAFGVLALLLAAIGLYGVMSYSVGQRRGEIAVRMALGADAATILRLIVGHGTALVVVGVLVGAVISLWAASYVQSLLFGIEARDVGTLVAAALVLALAGLLSIWLPAWRASKIDPAKLLREG